MESQEKTFTEIRQEISDEEMNSLTVALKQRYGIDFTNYELKSLKRGIARLISKHNFGSLLGLWGKVLKDREFFHACIDDLMVNLTELFRNYEVWEKMKQSILPSINVRTTLNVWHAGCSTGEEIYTMLIVLDEAGLLTRSSITATDLSSVALAKAMEGKYSQILWPKYLNSYQKYNPKGNLGKYFVGQNEDYVRIKDDYKKYISFQRHNLVHDRIDKKFHLIFCRNVMIYFDDVLKMKVLKLFHESLDDDGFFVIGYYDMLPDQSKELFVLHDPVTRIYKKVKRLS